MNPNFVPPAPIIAPEELSRRRLNQLAELAHALHGEMPEFLGMTAFGSTVRGEATPASDVDMYVFMSLTDAENSSQHNPRVKPDEKTGFFSDVPNTLVFHGGIELDYNAAIREHLPEQEIADADIIILPLDKTIVEDRTSLLLDNAKHYADGTKTLTELDGLAPRNIRGLFHAPIDNERLRPFIGQVLDQLAASPYGDQAWRMLRHMVIGFEQGREGNFAEKPHRTIPETLAEALKFYAVPESTER
jgi:hypothetical protein